MRFPYGEHVQVIRAAEVEDEYGEIAPDWSEATTVEYPECAVWPGSTNEPVTAGREPVDSDFTAVLPPGADVRPSDRVQIRGLVCDVAGRPFDWANPLTGWRPGVVVQAKIREG